MWFAARKRPATPRVFRPSKESDSTPSGWPPSRVRSWIDVANASTRSSPRWSRSFRRRGRTGAFWCSLSPHLKECTNCGIAHAERHELAGTLIDQTRRLTELLDAQSYTAFDKSDEKAPNALKYPKRALREAMVNALAHRSYELLDPTRITVFSNRVEIVSPGSLPSGIDLAALREGRAGPRRRNQALAWFLSRLQLAQAEGQGIPTILRTMREEGCPPPIFEADESRVTCILPAHPRHASIRERGAPRKRPPSESSRVARQRSPRSLSKVGSPRR